METASPRTRSTLYSPLVPVLYQNLRSSLSPHWSSQAGMSTGFPRALQTGDSHAETRRAYPGVSFLKIILFVYFWLQGLFSGCRAWAASLCSGFSLWGAQALGPVGVSSCGSRAQLLRGVWDHPRSDIEPHWQADSLFLWNNQGCFPIRELKTPSAVQGRQMEIKQERK